MQYNSKCITYTKCGKSFLFFYNSTKMNIAHLLQRNQKLERKNHISLDAIINKVTQELGEVLEALEANNYNHTIEEIGDVLCNVLSTHVRLFGEEETTNLTTQVKDDKEAKQTDMMISLSRRNDAIQKHRHIYSKTEVLPQKVHDVTLEFLSQLVSLAHRIDPNSDLASMVFQTVQKFEDRGTVYLPEVDIKKYIIDVQDFPIPGITFKDISPLLRDVNAFEFVVNSLVSQIYDADVVIWLDARGFIFGVVAAAKAGKPFVMARKPWKLPWEIISQEYGLEYGKNELAIQKNAFQKGQKVAVVDDVLATGWSAQAVTKMIEALWAEVHSVNVVITLTSLAGREKLGNYNVNSLVDY